MKWDIQTRGFTADQELVDFAKGQVEKLFRIYDRIVGAEVYLKNEESENDMGKVSEIKLNVPGEDLYADFRSTSFERGIRECIGKLRHQLERKKAFDHSHRV